MGRLLQLTQKLLSSATLSNEIYWGEFLMKNKVVCVHTTSAKSSLFNNHRNKKVVGG
jgi:hypothetical protein